MPEITIAGNKYIGKRVTLLSLLKAGKIEEKIKEALEKGEFEKYAILYMSRADLFVSGDITKLSPDLLSPSEARELESFFFSLVEPELPKSEKSNETSVAT